MQNLLRDETREEYPTLDVGGDCGPSAEVLEVSTPGTNDDRSELDADPEDEECLDNPLTTNEDCDRGEGSDQ